MFGIRALTLVCVQLLEIFFISVLLLRCWCIQILGQFFALFYLSLFDSEFLEMSKIVRSVSTNQAINGQIQLTDKFEWRDSDMNM